ncbi:hypothetical protein ACQUSY_07025 [Microbacterium sp. YY-03]|uniref:hypothetical protein n=1 Tax=Microbacterium sp. YY-03 TaxID=3421636 RepID=UPI003D169A9D
MSVEVLHTDAAHGPGAGYPPGRALARWVAMLLTGLLMITGLALGSVSPAQAATPGPGFGDPYGSNGSIGAFIANDGTQVYCMDLGAAAPWGNTTGPVTVEELNSHSGFNLSATELAKLNYVMAMWGQSGDPHVTAAVQLYVWSVADPVPYNSHGMSGDDYYVARAPAANRPQVLANLAQMRAQANANHAVNPQVSVSIDMADQYQGTLTVSASPSSLSGTVTLSNAVFANGQSTRALGAGSFPITGTPADGAPSYRIEASATVPAAGLGARVHLYDTPGQQRLLGGASPMGLDAHARTPVIELDFQPTITTQVSSRYVAEGDTFADQVTVGLSKGTWIHLNGTPVPVNAVGTLYGPFDEQPAEADAAPAGAPMAGQVELTLTGAGVYDVPATITAPESGFYTWVWEIDKNAQGQYAKYLTDSVRDRFGLVPETSIVPFQPIAVSEADQRLVIPGDTVTDTITVSSSNGAWLKIGGAHIPVIFEGTLYQVPGTLPPAQSPTVDPSAVPVGEVTVTADGPGVYTSPEVIVPNAGFVTWVWQVRLAAQPEELRDYLAGDWIDEYGIPVESTSVRHPIETTSQLREYNVHEGGRAFDTIIVSGFPDNHPDFKGDGYWGADTKTITHTAYGPFATDTVLTDDLDLTDAPVLTRVDTPARNGVYQIGYTDVDRITPTEPGYYVIVSSFDGDDRVQPYQSSPADIRERFFVPEEPEYEAPVSVITQATPSALVGEPFEDTALVQGTIPGGAYLVFRAYGPVPADEAPLCEAEPFYVSDEIPVTQPAVYSSGTTSVESAGNVYWVETLYDADGEVLSEGACGAPGETTVVTEGEKLTVTTKAVANVVLGEPAHDVAIVTGPVPEGTTLVFEAYRQYGDEAVCEVDNRVFDTWESPIAVTGPSEYASAEVVFDKVGTYFWIETLLDTNGESIHRGLCGTPGETTVVSEVPVTPETPVEETPQRELAQTGADGWLIGVGAAAALSLIASGAVLLFGRRLAQRREAAENAEGGEEPELVTLEDLLNE